MLFISASTAFSSLVVLFCVFCHSAEVATGVNTLDRRVIIRTRRSLDFILSCSIINADQSLEGYFFYNVEIRVFLLNGDMISHYIVTR